MLIYARMNGVQAHSSPVSFYGAHFLGRHSYAGPLACRVGALCCASGRGRAALLASSYQVNEEQIAIKCIRTRSTPRLGMWSQFVGNVLRADRLSRRTDDLFVCVEHGTTKITKIKD